MIVCAALKIDQPQPIGYIMVCGLRHADCYETLQLLDAETAKKARKYGLITEGFLNTEDLFLDRRQALTEAVDCGQLSAVVRHMKHEKNEDELYTEDLY